LSIEPGQSLAHYRLVEKIGEGGMGVVWKAVDTTLDREVAIKILPEQLARETERLARFEREAKLLASLNHANIAAVYGLHEADGLRFIAMELVAGVDLSQRLEHGPLPVDEALAAAQLIAQALEAAHENGTIHRDLKPANVKLAPDGAVKVLDFGLAKAFEPETAAGSASMSRSPTMTSAGSVAGMILGTASYMSPEQARGKPVDRRADVWAFGCVLYELLTAKRPFEGETVTDVLARVVQSEPDWDALPADTPPRIRALLKRCLRKDALRRLRDAGDARVEIEDVLSGEGDPLMTATGAATSAPRRSLWPLALVLVSAVILAVTLTALFIGPGETSQPTVSFTVDLPEGLQRRELSMSPDGRNLALIAQTPTMATELWLRSLDVTEPRALPGTQGASYPFWSPDGRSIGFFLQGKLKRIDLDSEATQTLADAPNGRGGAWNADGEILFAPEGRDGLYVVPDSGGTPRQVTTLDAEREETSHRFPHFLPDGRRFTYFGVEGDDPEGRVYITSLDSDERTFMIEGRSEAYAASGLLFHVRERNLVAQRLDLETLELDRESLAVAQEVATSVPVWARSAFAVSRNGALAYVSGRIPDEELVWFDRSGERLESVGEPGIYMVPRLSPDAQLVAFQRPDAGNTDMNNIWLLDLVRGTLSQFGNMTPFGGIGWSADGDGLVFVSERAVFRQRIGSAEPQDVLFPAAPTTDPTLPTVPGEHDTSRDGKFLVLDNWSSATDWDLWVLPLDGESKPTRFVTAPATQRRAQVSPDGKWIAYESSESGSFEVYVQGYPGGGKWILSSGGGTGPRWRNDGRELFYLAADSSLMSVRIDTDSGFEAGSPTTLFQPPASSLESFEVAPDGQRFLLDIPVESQKQPELTIVLNWTADS